MQQGRTSKARRTTGTADTPDSDGTREKLLQAAAEVFAETGYYGATVRQICARAGTNIALVNYHFGDKMGLYTEVLQQTVRTGHVNAIRGALDQNGPPEDILRAIVRARMSGMCGGNLADRQFRIVIHELANPTPAMARVVDEVTRPIYKRVLELIGGMIGLAPEDEKTRLCAHSVMGQIMLYALARPFLTRLWPELKMTPEQLDRIADHIADFSFAYLRQAGAQKRAAAGKTGGPIDDTARNRSY
jgi:TetR/AcrR family transcriptional regulator, regulator of cefoperazone and chloramphenicol sensitivity